MNQQHAILHLSLIDGVGPIALHAIMSAVEAICPWHEIYLLKPADWIRLGLKPALARQIYEKLQERELLEAELERMERHAILWVTMVDEAYPQRLRSIYAAPPLLYYKGTLPSNTRKHLAFVGSRQANQYGKKIIEELIPELVAHDFTIVSGGATGADSMAHRATITAGGTTLVVLGSGLLKPYPYQNKKLFEDVIAAGGAVMTTFPLQTDPLPGHFVARNRVIAGLSDGVVVVQAAHKSGTRITAQFALEQGRDVFAVPGAFDDPLSAGCHALIQQGAKLITRVEDILEDYGVNYLQKAKSSVESIELLKEAQPHSLEQQIVALCRSSHSIDEIAAKTATGLKELQLILFEMHVAGLVEQDFAGLWRAV